MMGKDINLLPAKYGNGYGAPISGIIRYTGFIITVLGLVLSFYIPLYAVDDLKNKAAGMRYEIMEMRDIAGYRETLRRLETDIRSREKAVASLKSAYPKWSEVLADIKENRPPGIDLEALNYGKGGSMEITGRADGYGLVSRYMVRLQAIEVISRVQPVNITTKDDGSCVFVVRCHISIGGE